MSGRAGQGFSIRSLAVIAMVLLVFGFLAYVFITQINLSGITGIGGEAGENLNESTGDNGDGVISPGNGNGGSGTDGVGGGGRVYVQYDEFPDSACQGEEVLISAWANDSQGNLQGQPFILEYQNRSGSTFEEFARNEGCVRTGEDANCNADGRLTIPMDESAVFVKASITTSDGLSVSNQDSIPVSSCGPGEITSFSFYSTTTTLQWEATFSLQRYDTSVGEVAWAIQERNATDQWENVTTGTCFSGGSNECSDSHTWMPHVECNPDTGIPTATARLWTGLGGGTTSEPRTSGSTGSATC